MDKTVFPKYTIKKYLLFYEEKLALKLKNGVGIIKGYISEIKFYKFTSPYSFPFWRNTAKKCPV